MQKYNNIKNYTQHNKVHQHSDNIQLLQINDTL